MLRHDDLTTNQRAQPALRVAQYTLEQLLRLYSYPLAAEPSLWRDMMLAEARQRLTFEDFQHAETIHKAWQLVSALIPQAEGEVRE